MRGQFTHFNSYFLMKKELILLCFLVTFFSYQYQPIKRIKLSTGPLYRLNNDSGLMVAQYGGDIKLYKSIWLTSRILQIRRDLNYLNQLPKLLDEPTLEDVQAMAQTYIKPDQWTWLIVGDLDKIEEPIRNLNLGTVKVIN